MDPQTPKEQNEKLTIPELEEKINAFWQEDKTFEKTLEKTKKGKPFTFYDGPPFATGLPHYGHILASTIKDLIPRYQTMQGHFVRRRWGWDCHGLPIEEIVERKLGISGKKQIEEIGIKKFNETCRSQVLEFADEWGKMVRRMGRWIEFDNSYKTMDRSYMESVWWAFKEIYDKGLVYEGRKVLLYCPRCETPISNFEVAMDNSYKDVTEESVYVKFEFSPNNIEDEDFSREILKSQGEDLSGLPWNNPFSEKPTYFLAWTTTPWTLPGNVALAVGSEMTYAFVDIGEEVLILAKDRIEKLNITGKILAEVSGDQLRGARYVALFDIPAIKDAEDMPGKAFSVYPADFVTTEDGTGIVHTAVVYGEDDYKLGQAVGLPVVPLLDEKGKFNEKAPEFIRGDYFKKSEEKIKADLEKRGLLFKRETGTHSYPHCWRCGTMLFYNAIPAWFINIQKIKPELLKSNNEEINWFPDHLKHGRYEKSVEAAPDWNISRNRYWGNPIPVWKCEKCDKHKVAGSIADLGLPPTTFYFLRHGEGEQNVLGVGSSYPELKTYSLTAKGKEQAAAAAKKLKALEADMVFASDIVRTEETARIIAEALGKEVVLDERLREIGLGIWNGKPVADLMASQPKDGWQTSAPEGGENWPEVESRMMEFVHEASAKYPGKKIAIISHGDPLWLVLKKLDPEYSSYPEFAEINEIKTGLTDLHRPYIDEVVLKCGCGGDMRRTPEIFDSWVEAGSMPFSEYHYPFENKALFESRFPAQFVAEYIAQTRAWFYVMHVIGLELFGKAPFENVVTTGTILAEDGSKMSKSKNNFPDPWAVINKYGVDTLRFYLMNSVVMQADNLNFSEKDLENAHRKVVLILWNVFQYFQTYAGGHKAGFLKEVLGKISGESHVLDRWIAARRKQLVIEVTDYLDKYDTVKATRTMENFINDFSTWYLRRSRGREDAGFFPAFRETLEIVSKVIAPVMPHLAEVIYQGVTGEMESVHLSSWPKKEVLTAEEQELLKQMETVREAASLCLALRKQLNIPVRQPLPCMSIGKDISPELLEVLKAEVNIKEITAGVLSGEGMRELEDEKGGKIVLDTRLSDELRLEGLTRNLERFVQELRKNNGFKVGEKAALTYQSNDADMEKAFAALDVKKTYIQKVERGESEGAEVFSSEGKEARISIRRA